MHVIVPMALSMPVFVRVLVHSLYSTSLTAAAQPAVVLLVIGKYDNTVPRIR